jgi:hypothetical protein
MTFTCKKSILKLEKEIFEYCLSLISDNDDKYRYIFKFRNNIDKLMKNLDKFIKMYQNGELLKIFRNPLQLNYYSVSWNNNHLKPEHKYYKHCNQYAIPKELQKFYGKENVVHIMYHSEDDILENTYFTNCNLRFGGNFPPLKYYKNDQQGNKITIDNPVFLYIIEQSADCGIEQIHLVFIQNIFELGSKHFFLAKKLNILNRVVEAGEIKRISENEIVYNTDSGTWIEFNEKLENVPKVTPIEKYFCKLGELNNVKFTRVGNGMPAPTYTVEDIKIFTINNSKIFYDPTIETCCFHNWELVREQDITTDTKHISALDLTMKDGQVLKNKKINKIICTPHLDNGAHYARPLTNFIKNPTPKTAYELINESDWSYFTKNSQIDREGLKQFIAKNKNSFTLKGSEIPITEDLFMVDKENILKETPDLRIVALAREHTLVGGKNKYYLQTAGAKKRSKKVSKKGSKKVSKKGSKKGSKKDLKRN